jgi:hypothetical protein
MANTEIWVALASGGGAGLILAGKQVWSAITEGAEKREDKAAEKIKETQSAAIRRAELAEALYEWKDRQCRWWINRATRLERVIILKLGEDEVPQPTTPEPEAPDLGPGVASDVG